MLLLLNIFCLWKVHVWNVLSISAFPHCLVQLSHRLLPSLTQVLFLINRRPSSIVFSGLVINHLLFSLLQFLNEPLVKNISWHLLHILRIFLHLLLKLLIRRLLLLWLQVLHILRIVQLLLRGSLWRLLQVAIGSGLGLRIAAFLVIIYKICLGGMVGLVSRRGLFVGIS